MTPGGTCFRSRAFISHVNAFTLRMKRLQARIGIFASIIAAATFAAAGAAMAAPKKPDDSNAYPNSIMKDEGGAPAKAKRPVRRGSSSPSPVPPYRSVVTPLGRAPGVIEPPAVGRTAPGSRPVPGFSSTLPSPPPSLSGQSFQDRAAGCVHHGSSVGVGAGQIGAYTQGCVNTR